MARKILRDGPWERVKELLPGRDRCASHEACRAVNVKGFCPRYLMPRLVARLFVGSRVTFAGGA